MVPFWEILRAKPALLVVLVGGLAMMSGSAIILMRRPRRVRDIEVADETYDRGEELGQEELGMAACVREAHALPSRLGKRFQQPPSTKYATLGEGGSGELVQHSEQTSQVDHASDAFFELD